MAHAATGRFRGPVVAGESPLEALLVQHLDGDLQPLQKVRRRRIGEEAFLIGGKHVLPIPEGPRQLRFLRCGQRLVGDRIEGQSGREHQSLLGPPDGDVDPPLLVPVVDRAERGDRVDEE